MSVDHVWLTCCTLHNWLLDIDGIGGVWNGGIAVSDWTGANGDMDFEGLNQEIPNALARLCQNLDPQNYDSSGMGQGSDVVWDDMVERHCVLNLLLNSISLMSLTNFCRRLVEHHTIQFLRNTLIWPTNNNR